MNFDNTNGVRLFGNLKEVENLDAFLNVETKISFLFLSNLDADDLRLFENQTSLKCLE